MSKLNTGGNTVEAVLMVGIIKTLRDNLIANHK
jgi:hypothetical protein